MWPPWVGTTPSFLRARRAEFKDAGNVITDLIFILIKRPPPPPRLQPRLCSPGRRWKGEEEKKVRGGGITREITHCGYRGNVERRVEWGRGDATRWNLHLPGGICSGGRPGGRVVLFQTPGNVKISAKTRNGSEFGFSGFSSWSQGLFLFVFFNHAVLTPHSISVRNRNSEASIVLFSTVSQNQWLTAPRVIVFQVKAHKQVDVSQYDKTSETDQAADKRRHSVFIRVGSRIGLQIRLLHLYDLKMWLEGLFPVT